MNELIGKLRETRAEKAAQLEAIVSAATEEQRSKLSEEEQARFDALREEIEALDERIEELVAQAERQAVADQAVARLSSAPSVRVVSEPLTYERGGPHSYLRDLALATLRNDVPSWERLRRHAAEVRVEVEQRTRRGELPAEYRDISRTDGAGGEFVPPIWLLDQYAALARASRVTADLIPTSPLPPGTDSINLPRVTGGASTAPQSDNAAVSETDMTTGSVAAPVTTIAGQQDAALQLIEQSPAGMDEVIFADLLASYAATLNAQVLAGNGTAPNHRGILNTAGINTVTYTSTTPSVAELYPKLADAVNRVHANRLQPAEVIVMHPRRWNWILAALDTNSRPLVVPNPSYGGFNPIAVQRDVVAQGVAGSLAGLPVYLDALVPTNLGAGTNEDVILVFRPSDCRLWEGPLRTRVLQEVLSGTLAVRFQVYAYSAFLAGRYPQAISTVGGTGLVAPTF